ncbi:hypothetical protein EIP91_007626 [Steccherinum ochraceum]|uniref:Uncharacterized protein n=1 Tax=Steccherinum ochraceum TaxID=92696 RepID=A0A4R0REC4_9APHY|nr:hypothetical protein EIP91_007626 [Steccherinum ochraceum]
MADVTVNDLVPIVTVGTLLDKNSLYIVLQPLSISVEDNGYYHWAIYIVDDQGQTTRHHWVQVQMQRRSSPNRPEEYDHRVIGEGRALNATPNTHHPILMYAKVQGYRAPAAGTYDFVGKFRAIFGNDSFPTTSENRENGTSCATFVSRAIDRLVQDGVINGDRSTIINRTRLASYVLHQMLARQDIHPYTSTQPYLFRA